MWETIKKTLLLYSQVTPKPLPPTPAAYKKPEPNVFFAGNAIQPFYDSNPTYKTGELLKFKTGTFRIKSVLRDMIKKRIVLKVEELYDE